MCFASTEDAETKYLKAAQASDWPGIKEGFQAMEASRKSLEETLAKIGNAPLFQGNVSLSSAYQKFQGSVNNTSSGVIGIVETANSQALASAPNYPLFVDIQKQLAVAKSSFSNRLTEVVSAKDAAEMKGFDEAYLEQCSVRGAI